LAVADMTRWGRQTRRRWFLPYTPDLLGLLRGQAAVTVEGMDAFVAWAQGEASAGDRVRELEHLADERKCELRVTLTEALAPALEPEDLFELSQGLDGVLNRAKNTVREAELMGAQPDNAIAEMAAELAEGVRNLAAAFDALGDSSRRDDATRAADRAIKNQRRVEHRYRAAMSALIGVEDVREVTAKRELYRRLVRTSDHLANVAERVWYAVLKAS
jgi:uncharacterized protein Yka (UPF0111/DUF47 family)